MLARDRGDNDLASLLPQFCFQLFADRQANCEPLISATRLLYDVIVLFDDIIDDEINVSYWSEHYREASDTLVTRGTIANVITAFTAKLGQALLSLPTTTGCSQKTAETIHNEFLNALHDTACGQQMSLVIKEPTLDESWQVSTLKSGAFFSLACWSGVYLATEDAHLAEKFRSFGKELGILVQISDDLSDLWPNDGGDSDIMGPSWSLPIAYGMQVLPEAERTRLGKLLSEAQADSKTAEETVRTILLESGAIVYLGIELEKHYRLAKAILEEHAPLGPARAKLLNIVDQIKEILPT